MRRKAELFDYLCWLNVTEQSDHVPESTNLLVFASDGSACWGKSYAQAVEAALHHDSELYSACVDAGMVPESKVNPTSEQLPQLTLPGSSLLRRLRKFFRRSRLHDS